MCNSEDYFYKRVYISKKIWISVSLILQGLTEVLKSGYQNILIVNSPDTATKWYIVETKLAPEQSPTGMAVRNIYLNYKNSY